MSGREIELCGLKARWQAVTVAGHTYRVLVPQRPEALIDTPAVVARFERDEYLPYWAELWPSAVRLAELVAEWRFPAARVLDLGCGLGLVSLALARAGHAVTAGDYDADALRFVEANAAANGLLGVQTMLIDWRSRYPELRFERIVAADVLYERRHVADVPRFVAGHLTADGEAWLVDPRRAIADDLPVAARACGLAVSERPLPGDARGAGERLFVLTHRQRAA